MDTHDFVSHDEVLRAWDKANTIEDAASAAFHLAMAASPTAGMEEPILSRFSAALRHHSAEVRETALRAMAFLEWPELKPIISDIAARDDDPDIRQDANSVLDAYDHFGWDKTG